MTPVEDLLRLVVEEGGSDLHLTVGSPPAMRLHGDLVKLRTPPVTAPEMEDAVRAITKDSQMKRVYEEGGADFGMAFREDARFRVSVFLQKGSLGMVCRLLPKRLLSTSEIGLPPALEQLIRMPRGLILVTGPTGSGKTTTLASLLNILNETSRSHIVTLEDPIEYFHEHKAGLFNQREVGTDVPTFAEGLKRALRQDPDVILVGEMRDLETMEAAVTAAETGHLVFSTLHTTGAARTVDRIIDAFPIDGKEQIRTQLAGNLRAVLSQILVPTVNGKGRVAAFELMVNTPAIGTLIRENKTYRIGQDIQTGSKFGMVSLESSLVDLHRRKLISREQVLSKAQDATLAAQLLDDAR